MRWLDRLLGPALLLCACLATACANTQWQPTGQPDPMALLDEAESDMKSKRHAQALEKLLWLHHNAPGYAPAFAGVRLSFALVSWYELAQQYPPAMTELKAVRDEAHRKLIAGNGKPEDFHDLAAINDVLDEMDATAKLFVWLDQHDPALARRAYFFAETALIDQKLYQLCGKYIDTRRDLDSLLRIHQLNLRLASDQEFLEYTQKSLAYKASVLVALLTLNQRAEEADHVMREVLRASPEESLRLRLEEARTGQVPKAWARLRS